LLKASFNDDHADGRVGEYALRCKAIKNRKGKKMKVENFLIAPVYGFLFAIGAIAGAVMMHAVFHVGVC
jgi:hypothetical protein